MPSTASRPTNKTMEENNLFNYLKGSATFTVTRRPFIPNHDKKSCPMASLIPIEVRHRRASRRFFDVDREPTSPKVSCIGQIKHKKSMRRIKSLRETSDGSAADGYNTRRNKKYIYTSFFLKLFNRKPNSTAIGKKRDDTTARVPVNIIQKQVPHLGQMNQFRSGRTTLGEFDWNAWQKDDGEKVSSVPIFTDVEEKMDGDLWKRRMVVPPQRLQLN
ncbi:hypothetical protein ZOSMA_103G00570 [Zostera marina]|uniref:Uncharacterized protein n=1 Tax=Zostera marina TaxID=29655 RepID=A0A0K9Q500_ZOSMR|nr:hypothetical protein ZOSMA_103G00570 [Zostera marina]